MRRVRAAVVVMRRAMAPAVVLVAAVALVLAGGGVAGARARGKHRHHHHRRHHVHGAGRRHHRPGVGGVSGARDGTAGRGPGSGSGAGGGGAAGGGAGGGGGAAGSSACADAQLTPAAGNLDRVAAATLCLVNLQRRDAGVAPLGENAKLDQVAGAHSQDMTTQGYFDHVSPGGSTPQSRMTQVGYISDRVSYTVGENIAWATGPLATPASIVDDWMHSPGHRANILDGNFRDTGMGVSLGSVGPLGGGDTGAAYTQDFGVVG